MERILLPSRDPRKFCRLCLSQINLMTVIERDIHESSVDGPAAVVALLRTYTPLKLDPVHDLPCAVCSVCTVVLQNFDVLYRDAVRYDSKIRVLTETVFTLADGTGPPAQDESVTMVELFEFPLESTVLLPVEVERPNEVPEEKSVDVYHVDGELKNVVLKELTALKQQVPREQQQKEEIEAFLPQYQISNGSVQTINLPIATSMMEPRRNTLTPVQSPVKPPLKRISMPVVLNKETDTAKRARLIKEAKAKRSMMDSEPHQCPHCQTTFLKVGNLRNHVTLCHSSQKKMFRCNHCQSRFVESSNFQQHVDNCPAKGNQQPAPAKPVTPPAPKVTTPAARVVPEVTTPQGAQTRCQLCRLSFRNSYSFNRHQYESHGICSKEFGFNCTLCQMRFSQKADFELHNRVIHPNLRGMVNPLIMRPVATKK